MMGFDTADVELLPFYGWPHLQNHINYLFRTDAKQKWTNCYSVGNLLIIGDSVYLIGKTLEERKKTAKVARDIIRRLKADYSAWHMCCVERLGGETYSRDGSLVEDVIKAVQELDEELEKDYMKILFAVVHVDQRDPHFHVVVYDPQ